MSTTDVLILIPLIPLAPVLVTWWLPWERWLFEKAPQKLLNLLVPYFLYGAFAAWHFKLGIWVMVCAILGAVVSLVAALIKKYAN